MGRPRAAKPCAEPQAGLYFLLSQVGIHAASRFAEALVPLKLTPPHAGILRAVKMSDGLSQQALGEKLGMFPSRLVQLIDELQQRGLVERRDNPADRRSYALHLTDAGREALEQIGRIVGENQAALCAALNDEERAQLADFLGRIAAQQQLTPGIHPGYRKSGPGRQK